MLVPGVWSTRRIGRVFGYGRVSTELQGLGVSLNDQQASMATFAQAIGLGITETFVESESGTHEAVERRERMQALLARVRAGDLVLCDKLDRWSRDPEFSYRTVRQLLELGAYFYAVGDQCDPSTSDGDTLMSIRIMMAKEEYKRIRDRMLGTRRRLADAGYYAMGQPPFGYRRRAPQGSRDPERHALIIESSEAAAVRRVFVLCAAGEKVMTIVATMGLTRDRILTMLRSRIYRGEVRDSHGVWIAGRQEAIIDEGLFQRAQAALNGRSRGGGREGCGATSTWLLRNVARCARCGRKMGARYSRWLGAERGYHNHYYVCPHSCGPHVRVYEVEEQVEPFVLARLIELREEIAKAVERKEVAKQDFGAELAKLELRRAKLLDRFADGSLTKDDLRERLVTLDEKKVRHLEAQARQRRRAIDDASTRRVLLGKVATMRRAWTLAKPADKRKLVNLLCSSVRLERGSDPRPIWRSAEELAEEVKGAPAGGTVLPTRR